MRKLHFLCAFVLLACTQETSSTTVNATLDEPIIVGATAGDEDEGPIWWLVAERSPHLGREIRASKASLLNPWSERTSKIHDVALACPDDGLEQAA